MQQTPRRYRARKVAVGQLGTAVGSSRTAEIPDFMVGVLVLIERVSRGSNAACSRTQAEAPGSKCGLRP